MFRKFRSLHVCLAPACLLSVQTALGAAATPDADALEQAFAIAGFERQPDGRYVRCHEDPPSMSYLPGQAETADLNDDGNPELWITESSIFCYGATGTAFVLLTREGGQWRVLLVDTGVPNVLDRRHYGWPDIEVGGPGFDAAPVYQWNRHAYVQAPQAPQ